MKNTKANSFSRTTKRNVSKEETNPPAAEDALLSKAKDDRKILGFRISDDKRRAFKVKAAQEGTTVQEVLSSAVDEYLSK